MYFECIFQLHLTDTQQDIYTRNFIFLAFISLFLKIMPIGVSIWQTIVDLSRCSTKTFYSKGKMSDSVLWQNKIPITTEN